MPTIINPEERSRLENLSIRHLANKLLDDSSALPVTEDSVVDTGKILDFLGYSYYEFDPSENISNIKGAVIHADKKVLLNSGLSPQEKNFSLAHEIGHIVLHKGGDKIDFLQHSLEEVHIDEIEANVFAYELLMPIYHFRTKLKNNHDLTTLAEFYCLSEKRVNKRIEFEKRLSHKLQSLLSLD